MPVTRHGRRQKVYYRLAIQRGRDSLVQPAPWQWTRGSALLTGVGDDALYLAKHLFHQLEPDTASSDATREKRVV